MRSLMPFIALVQKEWRDARALTLACLALVPAALLALELGFLDWRGDFAGSTFVPIVIALFLAVVTSDIVAADVTSGRARVYAALPVRPSTLWAAKISFVVLAGLGFTAWTLAVTTSIYAAWAPPMQFAALLHELERLPLIGLAGGVCVIAATVVWSTVLERGLAAVGAGIVTCALIGGVFPLLASIDPELLPTKSAIENAFLALPLVFLVASLVAFVRGPVHASTLLRRAGLAVGVMAMALLPTGAVWASVLVDRLDVSPGDPAVSTTLVSVSPDREHAILFASKSHPHAVHRTWVVRLDDGHVVELPGKGQRLDWTKAWQDDGTLRIWIDSKDDSVRHEIDPDTGAIERTRSRDQVIAGGEDPWQRCNWADFQQHGTTTEIQLRDGTEPIVLPHVVHTLPLVDRAWRQDNSRIVLYDVRSGETTEVELGTRPDGAYPSPGGRYLRAWKGRASWVVDALTGRIVRAGDVSVSWPGGGSDDHFCLLLRADRQPTVLDLRSGAEREIPEHVRSHTWTNLRVLDADTWLVVTTGNVLTEFTLDEANTTRTIYDPNAPRGQ